MSCELVECELQMVEKVWAIFFLESFKIQQQQKTPACVVVHSKNDLILRFIFPKYIYFKVNLPNGKQIYVINLSETPSKATFYCNYLWWTSKNFDMSISVIFVSLLTKSNNKVFSIKSKQKWEGFTAWRQWIIADLLFKLV